jgi:uncharacterized membrane protein YuzA (DUF378 family)
MEAIFFGFFFGHPVRMSSYFVHKMYALAVLLVVIGGLNWGYLAFTGKDFVSLIFGKGAVANGIFLAVGIAAICIAFYRDTYLPFLGSSVLPCSVLEARTPEGADFERRVLVRPGVKVLYWAAEPANKDLQTIQDYKHAYLEYRNAGVAVADSDGYATLRVRKPQPYNVPMKGELPAHIHYRVCMGEGFIGPVQTVGVDGTEWFENLSSNEETNEQKEMFENVHSQEEHEEAKGPAIAYPIPEKSVFEVNVVAANTALRSLMPQEGALDEAPHPGGYDIDEAYRPAGPASFTAVNYS